MKDLLIFVMANKMLHDIGHAAVVITHNITVCGTFLVFLEDYERDLPEFTEEFFLIILIKIYAQGSVWNDKHVKLAYQGIVIQVIELVVVGHCTGGIALLPKIEGIALGTQKERYVDIFATRRFINPLYQLLGMLGMDITEHHTHMIYPVIFDHAVLPQFFIKLYLFCEYI